MHWLLPQIDGRPEPGHQIDAALTDLVPDGQAGNSAERRDAEVHALLPPGYFGVELRDFVAGAAARLIRSPSISPSHASRSASAMRAARFSLISASRVRCAGSGRRSAHRNMP
ncbi:hypothetical protein ACIRL2_28340 [Embleya sp. NPDC127516]|uniref:hypothetical protein n=1 Tax=Embleya sp. NPDC127516 TaxID=3363990 RepID=UPI0038248DB8